MENTLTHGSLFSGIGGFDIGAERANIPTVWNCEIEKYQTQILKKINKDAEQYNDITNATITRYVDIISGGFPCQDISVAGKMEGIKGERSGLWSEMHRIIRHIRPLYVIIENSPALLIRGFEHVLCDLSKIGYNAEWQVISNASFGYPHRRDRLYVIAYAHQEFSKANLFKQGSSESIFRSWTPSIDCAIAMSKRIYQITEGEHIRNGDGFRHWTNRVGSLGNAVNPTIAHYVFECIKQHYNQNI